MIDEIKLKTVKTEDQRRVKAPISCKSSQSNWFTVSCFVGCYKQDFKQGCFPRDGYISSFWSIESTIICSPHEKISLNAVYSDQ